MDIFLKKIFNVIKKYKDFLYRRNVKKRDKYLIKNRGKINDEIEKFFQGKNYYLGFGIALKYYRDNSFSNEDLDYVVDCIHFEKMLKINDYNSNFKVALVDKNKDFPVMIKLLYKRKALIDFFFVNNYEKENWIFVKDPIKSGNFLECDDINFKMKRESYTTLFKNKNFDTQIINYENYNYRLPKDILFHIRSVYGEKWNIHLNKEESYLNSDKLAKKLNTMGETYFINKYV